MLHIYYRDDDGSALDITAYVNLDDRNFSVIANAEQGSVGTSSFVVDDPLGELYLAGHRRVWVIEDDAPAEHQMVFWGYLEARDVTRGDEPPTTTARQWLINLADINSLVQRKVMAGNDTDRPEETDVERVQWLMTTGEAGFFDDTTTFIDTANPVDMDAVDYNGQMFVNILDDCAQQSGTKNYYIRWLWDGGVSDYRAAVWYGSDNAGAAESDLKISNVLADVDAWIDNTPADSDATWAASLDSKLNLDPSRVYSGIFGNYDGGYTYRTRSGTIAEFANRDTVMSWPNVKTLTKAQARADRELNTLHTEEEVITTSILVPPFNVNDAMAGDLINVRYSHLPRYEEFRAVRILNRTVTFVTPEVYQIDYDLTPIADLASCGTVVSFMESYADSDLNYPGGNTPLTVPIVLTPSTTPSVIITSAGLLNTFERLGDDLATASPYTDVGGYKNAGGLDYNHILTSAAYDAISSGSAADLDFSWTAATRAYWDAKAAIALPTAATSPVQTASVNTAGPVVLGGAPSVGHILVASRQFQALGGSPVTGIAPSGWVQVAAAACADGGVSHLWVDIIVRCVQAGDGTSWAIGSGDPQQALTVMEWALT